MTATPSPDLYPPLVRIVDDEESVRRSASFTLRVAGFNAVTYESARDFLDRDDLRHPGCVVLDVRMPEMSGLELQQEDSDRAHALLGQLQRVEDYVGMALCFARLTPDASDLLYRRQRLDPIVKAAARKYSSFFVSKNISFVYKDTGAEILTDEKWLGFLLEQLLSNAVKYTERGEVAVFLDENQVLHVKDTGIGIAPEELPRIFDKGFTGGNGRAQQRSTGLGLYLSQRAAERIGAVLTVQSEVGKGSDFRIDLSESQRAALQK